MAARIRIELIPNDRQSFTLAVTPTSQKLGTLQSIALPFELYYNAVTIRIELITYRFSKVAVSTYLIITILLMLVKWLAMVTGLEPVNI